MLFKSKLEKLLSKMRKSRKKGSTLFNVVFLDFDGVINLDKDNYDKMFELRCIKCLNKICKEYDASLVITSSFRKYKEFEERLYVSGLDKNIKILGKTKYLESREEEIINYLLENPYIKKFIILDDSDNFDILENYHIKTDYIEGFSGTKYKVAKLLFDNQEEI